MTVARPRGSRKTGFCGAVGGGRPRRPPSRRPFWERNSSTSPGVDDRGCLLHVAVGVIDLLGHPVVADVEVLEAALGLRAPVPVGGNLDVAEAVEFASLPHGVETNG